MEEGALTREAGGTERASCVRVGDADTVPGMSTLEAKGVPLPAVLSRGALTPALSSTGARKCDSLAKMLFSSNLRR